MNDGLWFVAHDLHRRLLQEQPDEPAGPRRRRGRTHAPGFGAFGGTGRTGSPEASGDNFVYRQREALDGG